MKRSYGSVLFPAAGVLFCLWYVCSATSDVVYSDYIRLINSYLPDVWNPEKFFVPDIFTRIPVNFLGRGINVECFHFSVRFDQILGILGLGLAAWVTGIYIIKERLGFAFLLAVMVLMFSLNKWEMLTNGSGWAHFLAFACFYYYYLALDRVWQSGKKGIRPGNMTEKPWDRPVLLLLPFVTTLGIAGQYCAIYSGVMIVVYGFLGIWNTFIEADGRFWAGRGKDKGLHYWLWLLCILIPLALYIVSNTFTVEEHAGATDLSFTEALRQNPGFFPAFFIKSFAGMLLGGETIESRLQLPNRIIILMGVLVMGGYLLGLWLNIKYQIYERTLFPLLLILSGGCSHVLILISRWIFLNQENYGMSSRYAVQFQMGIIGIVLTVASAWKMEGSRRSRPGDTGRALGRKAEKRLKKHSMAAVLGVVFIGIILCGNMATTVDELIKAPYRKERYEEKIQAALNYRNYSDEELENIFEYRKGPEKIRRALEILEVNHWNVYGHLDIDGQEGGST